MQINPADLKRASGAFSDADTQLTTTVNSLFAQTAPPSEICGHDSTGQQAEAAFRKAQQDIATFVGKLTTAYGEIAGGLDQMVRNNDTAEWNVIAALPDIPGKFSA